LAYVDHDQNETVEISIKKDDKHICL